MHSIAKFAVVGHPNKGKSSIVSTLSHNTDIAISSRSGTTEVAHTYTVVTGKCQYDLIDTPGFQRPSRVLHWLKQHCNNASERSATVKKFLACDECKKAFKDEVELLKPIVQGAAILYVVDGSRPYGQEYEAEMEILRWTGQSSMALINPIENSEYVDEWENALSQFFKSVRVFNPLNADFKKQVELLKTFSYLNTNWSNSLNEITLELEKRRKQQIVQSADILARLVDDLCSFSTTQKAITKQQAQTLKPVIMRQYQRWMKQREETAIADLLNIFYHNTTYFKLEQFQLPPDLFDCEQWYMWGLNKRQLISSAAVAGAISGGTLDLAVAGSSFMLGSMGGGLLAAGSTWIGANKLVDIRVKGLPLGGYQASVGPIKNTNFPYVIIGRFLHLFRQISNLNHADRRVLDFSSDIFQKEIDALATHHQKALHLVCRQLVKQKPVEQLDRVLLPLFEESESINLFAIN